MEISRVISLWHCNAPLLVCQLEGMLQTWAPGGGTSEIVYMEFADWCVVDHRQLYACYHQRGWKAPEGQSRGVSRKGFALFFPFSVLWLNEKACLEVTLKSWVVAELTQHLFMCHPRTAHCCSNNSRSARRSACGTVLHYRGTCVLRNQINIAAIACASRDDLQVVCFVIGIYAATNSAANVVVNLWLSLFCSWELLAGHLTEHCHFGVHTRNTGFVESGAEKDAIIRSRLHNIMISALYFALFTLGARALSSVVT